MRSIVKGFLIVVCAVVSVVYSTGKITDTNWSVAGESSLFWYDVTCGSPTTATDKSGNIYAWQWDMIAGGRYIQSIAKWDHHKWTEIVPAGESSAIYSMLIDSIGNMYVGGWGTVQKFDGVTWQKMGKELSGMVSGLVINKRGELFAGTFESQDKSYVYKWSDTAWVIIGEIPRGHVSDLACDSTGNLFVCGKFDFIGGIGSNSVAKWDGSTWSSLEGGCSGINKYGEPFVCDVQYVKCIGNDVYFAGEFDSCGSKNIHAVARWDGSTWSSAGKGAAYSISKLHTDKNGCLYASGFRTSQNDESCKITKLINDEWVVMDSLDTLEVFDVVIDYSGNIFNLRHNFSQLVNGKWSLISNNGEGFDGAIYAFAYDRLSGYLYAGGSFTTIGNKWINHIARWDGKSWSNLGKGISYDVLTLVVGKDGTLYAGSVDWDEKSNTVISAWNGESWTEIAYSIQQKTFCQIKALALDSMGNLYAGGDFTSINGIPANNIARWDGKSWSALGEGIDGFNVSTLAVDKKGVVYAGGNFDKAGTDVCHNIAKWDGKAWSSLGEGVKNDLFVFESVNALVIDTDGNLFAGGQFSLAGGIDASNIAKWNGVSWSSLGSGIGKESGGVNYINALSLDENGNLYAGGIFGFADSLAGNSVARWDGNKWDTLGDVVKNYDSLDYTQTGGIYALQCNGKGMLYTGGDFLYAAGKTSNGFAQCNLNGPLKLMSSKNKIDDKNTICKRNDGLIRVRCNEATSIRYRIFSLTGRELNHEQKTITAGEYILQLKTAGLAKGAYIADIRADDASLQYRFVVR
jgi:hypothetical protein